MNTLLCIAGSAALFLAIGCGGAAEAKAPAAPAGFKEGDADVATKPRTIDDAVAAVAHAQLELDGVLQKNAAEPTVPGQPRKDGALHGPEKGGAASDPCSIACRSLGSMQDATTQLCQLAGDADARCQSAKEKVKAAGERVKAACPQCG